jgi:superfamily I DNA/RNA helicase
MRILPPVLPTPEQLTIMRQSGSGVSLIRGAAGSGKTTTALLRLKMQCSQRLLRRDRLGSSEPVRVLVLTYNRTLSGYVRELAAQQVADHQELHLEVQTFGKWAKDLVGIDSDLIVDRFGMEAMLAPLVRALPSDNTFLIDEVEYLLGRFPTGHLDSYVSTKREGRGLSPRMERTMRERLLAEVVEPYQALKAERGVMDWNDIAVAAGDQTGVVPWDVIIVDEAQDFSANQVRTVLQHADPLASVTFVMDAAQRIYPRYFTWREVGETEFAGGRHTLRTNYRNTREIAAFVQPLVEGMPLDGDGQIPDFTSCIRSGPLPVVVAGRYSQQIDFILNQLIKMVDFEKESVAFLQPKGGGWFSELRSRLQAAGLPFAELTRASVWPQGPEAVALCTLHSAKGLEFDHVVLPGLNQQVTPHGQEEGDVHLDALRRLIAMGLGRARTSVHIGFKPSDPSTVLRLFKPGTYRLVTR